VEKEALLHLGRREQVEELITRLASDRLVLREREDRENRTVLFPIRIDGAVMTAPQAAPYSRLSAVLGIQAVSEGLKCGLNSHISAEVCEASRSREVLGQRGRDKKMKQALLATFLLIFIATALVTLLGLIGWLPIEREYLRSLFYLLILEVVASVIALFNAMRERFVGDGDAAQKEIRRFCERAAGYWWSSGADPDSVGFAHIVHDQTRDVLRIVGRSYDLHGQIIATWNDRASCIEPKRGTVYYSWEGLWTRRPTEPYEGFAELRFDDSPDKFNTGHGVFSDRNLTDVKSITMKSSRYRRCSKPQVDVMEGSNSELIGALLRKELNI
jgi:hypothetical protein